MNVATASACRKSVFDTLKAVEKDSEFRFLAKEDVRWYLD